MFLPARSSSPRPRPLLRLRCEALNYFSVLEFGRRRGLVPLEPAVDFLMTLLLRIGRRDSIRSFMPDPSLFAIIKRASMTPPAVLLRVRPFLKCATRSVRISEASSLNPSVSLLGYSRSGVEFRAGMGEQHTRIATSREDGPTSYCQKHLTYLHI